MRLSSVEMNCSSCLPQHFFCFPEKYGSPKKRDEFSVRKEAGSLKQMQLQELNGKYKIALFNIIVFFSPSFRLRLPTALAWVSFMLFELLLTLSLSFSDHSLLCLTEIHIIGQKSRTDAMKKKNALPSFLGSQHCMIYELRRKADSAVL